MQHVLPLSTVIALVAVMVGCDERPGLCDTPATDVFGVHVLGASEGQYELESQQVVIRRFAAEMSATDPRVSARYTQAEPQDDSLVLDQVDCLTGGVIAPLDAGPRVLQFPEVACRAQCLVELCVQTENTADATVTVDEAVTIVFERDLSCGDVGRTEGQAPFFALEVSNLP